MKRKTITPALLASALQIILAANLFAGQVDIPGPAGSASFGLAVRALPNGNFVVLDPSYSDSGPLMNAGRVYLYDGKTLALISSTTGAANDNIGSDSTGKGIYVLANGNYVVASPGWGNGRGAVTLCSPTTGCPATISAANSLVGTNDASGGDADAVGGNGVVALPNGNYVVRSPDWNNGAAVDAGALTWCDGNTGCISNNIGPVSATNSRVGSHNNDYIGLIGIDVLSNGNYVSEEPFWNGNAPFTGIGAATFCTGNAPCTGVVSNANSLVGSTLHDFDYLKVVPLTNGNYVVCNGVWDNGSTVDVGAATFCDGTTGCHAVISPANSLIGTVGTTGGGNGDFVGIDSAVALSNGNYVVQSTGWNNGGVAAAGAATFCNGTTGCVGMTVSPSNSLVGSTAQDGVGKVTALTNGNYVANTPGWDNPVGSPLTTDWGAVTFCNGTAGCVGSVGAGNSLIGHRFGDGVGFATPLANGNYVVSSKFWTDNGFVPAVGAVTWCDGTTGCIGQVTAANSLTGSHSNDNVGNVTALTNGNYVVTAGGWDNGGISNVGAATFCSGTSGCVGAVSAGNSLVGSVTDDQVGSQSFALALTNGNYVVLSVRWNNGAATSAGALTPCSGTSGCIGSVSPANSLVGSTINDFLGISAFGDVTVALPNGDYILRSTAWDNGGISDAGAVVIGYRNLSTAGPITASNAVRGMVSGSGSSMDFSYDPTNGQIVVGRSLENIVTVFGQAVGGSPINLKITSISRLANGHIVLNGNGVVSAVHTVERSLVKPATASFNSLSPTTASGTGAIQYEDASATGLTKGFYRLSYP